MCCICWLYVWHCAWLQMLYLLTVCLTLCMVTDVVSVDCMCDSVHGYRCCICWLYVWLCAWLQMLYLLTVCVTLCMDTDDLSLIPGTDTTLPYDYLPHQQAEFPWGRNMDTWYWRKPWETVTGTNGNTAENRRGYILNTGLARYKRARLARLAAHTRGNRKSVVCPTSHTHSHFRLSHLFIISLLLLFVSSISSPFAFLFLPCLLFCYYLTARFSLSTVFIVLLSSHGPLFSFYRVYCFVIISRPAFLRLLLLQW
jgi:hypothetical protein